MIDVDFAQKLCFCEKKSGLLMEALIERRTMLKRSETGKLRGKISGMKAFFRVETDHCKTSYVNFLNPRCATALKKAGPIVDI